VLLRVAHRTSPTNWELALLANLSAHDFGYIFHSATHRTHYECVRYNGNTGALPGPLL